MNMPPSFPNHAKSGMPSHRYIYRDERGNPVLIANRYEKSQGGKYFLPYDVSGNAWKAPERRILYNLDQIITADPETPVIIVEGEKCADALSGLGYLATTVFGDCNGASKADLSPLYDRRVIIWPDNDSPGEKYGNVLKTTLVRNGTKRVETVSLHSEICRIWANMGEYGTLPKGWDAADAVESGWAREDVETLLSQSYCDKLKSAKMSEN